MMVVSFWIVLPFSAGPVRVNLPNIIQSLTPKKKQPSPNLQHPLFPFFGMVSVYSLIIFVVTIFNNSPE